MQKRPIPTNDIDRDYEDTLSGELTLCDRMVEELHGRRAALRRARLRLRMGVAADVVKAEVRQRVPTLLVESRCGFCERPLVLCECP